jgi:hypothetical protein
MNCESGELIWVKQKAGKRWGVFHEKGKPLGSIRNFFNGWDGYIVTGKKWPDSEKIVVSGATFWGARRAVVRALDGLSA